MKWNEQKKNGEDYRIINCVLEKKNSENEETLYEHVTYIVDLVLFISEV